MKGQMMFFMVLAMVLALVFGVLPGCGLKPPVNVWPPECDNSVIKKYMPNFLPVVPAVIVEGFRVAEAFAPQSKSVIDKACDSAIVFFNQGDLIGGLQVLSDTLIKATNSSVELQIAAMSALAVLRVATITFIPAGIKMDTCDKNIMISLAQNIKALPALVK